MSITHHPGVESLMSCSAGSMPEALAAVMASHIAVCPACRKELALMETIGTVLFEQLGSAEVERSAPVIRLGAEEAESGAGSSSASMSRTQSAPPVSAQIAATAGALQLPDAVRAAIGTELDKVRWRRLGPGVWHHRVPLASTGRGALRLIKVAPGQQMPEHTHEGSELTLVLQGAYEDSTGRYACGDVADMNEDVDHAPLADATSGCICLVATQGKLRFKSRLARLIRPLTGF